MVITTKQLLQVLQVLVWIIFVGLCFQAGAIIVSSILMVTVSPENVKHLWKVLDMSALHAYNTTHYITMAIVIAIVSVAKTLIFYQILRMLYDKRLTISQPFNKEANRYIIIIAYLALLIALFSSGGANFNEWLISQGVKMPDLKYLTIGGADVWLFMSVILFVIAQVFKRGIEIQSEIELTV